MTQVVVFGECMGELRPLDDGHWKLGFAGDTYNTAVYLRRLDRTRAHRIEYVSGVGDDSFAQQMLAAWHEEGIGVAYTVRVPGRGTGLYAISLSSTGERSFSYWRETSAARAYFDEDTTPLEQHAAEIEVLYLSGISLAIQTPAAIERLQRLVGRVRSMGGRFVFDNNYRPRLWNSFEEARRTMAWFMRRCDIALVTLDDQLALMPGWSQHRVTDWCLALPASEVAVKRGGSPTLVRGPDRACAEVAVMPVCPVDTTAAGDAFAAGYLTARWRGALPASAAAVGNALAGRVIQHPGALMPTKALMGDTEFWALLNRVASKE